ncbi:hypothetical protein EDB84DRAFT_851496 [Lactarius hengduanensis]|nr:hypothetical protein EDB84DRAFT_851496 [Lactarius hengduanensis]
MLPVGLKEVINWKAPSGTGTEIVRHVQTPLLCSLLLAAMYRLAAVALTFFVLFSSVLPLALPRAETNADRFKRGAPPLPPTRRDSANRADPSSRPPPTGSGHLVVRDITGRQILGYMQNSDSRTPIIGVSPLNSPRSARLQATYSGSVHTLVATNALFPAPYFLGSQFPYFNDPGASPPEEILFTNVVESPGAKVWSYQQYTRELTIALPKPSGGSVQAVFAWDKLQNALELVTDVPTYLAAAWESEPHDQQPVLTL